MERVPNLIETLSFLKFPDEKHLLHFSDDSDSESTIKIPKSSKSYYNDDNKDSDTEDDDKDDNKDDNKDNDTEDNDTEDDLLLSCTFNNIFTDTLTEKYKSPSKTNKSVAKSKKKTSIKSKKKTSIKSKKKSSIKSKKSFMKSKKSSMKSKKSFI